MASKIIRLMGESDIIDVDMEAHDGGAHPKLMGLDATDKINLLGHWMDQDRGEALADDPEYLSAMTAIAVDYINAHDIMAKLDAGANFVVLTILREKWPVGSKAKFQVVADRVQAEHTYVPRVCAAAVINDLDDDAELKQSETSQLAMALPQFRKNRKAYANSSAIHGLIRQGL